MSYTDRDDIDPSFSRRRSSRSGPYPYGSSGQSRSDRYGRSNQSVSNSYAPDAYIRDSYSSNPYASNGGFLEQPSSNPYATNPYSTNPYASYSNPYASNPAGGIGQSGQNVYGYSQSHATSLIQALENCRISDGVPGGGRSKAPPSGGFDSGYGGSPYESPPPERIGPSRRRSPSRSERTRPPTIDYDPRWTPGYTSGYARDYTGDISSQEAYDMIRKHEREREAKVQEDYDKKRAEELRRPRSRVDHGSRLARAPVRTSVTDIDDVYDSKPMEYEIARTRSGDDHGYHRRRRISIEASIPRPPPAYPEEKYPSRYPKRHDNDEKQYNMRSGDKGLEFPTTFGPPHYLPPGTQSQPRGQNSKGMGRNPDGSIVDPSIARGITNQYGDVYGSSFHPKYKMKEHERAPEINRKGRRQTFKGPEIWD